MREEALMNGDEYMAKLLKRVPEKSIGPYAVNIENSPKVATIKEYRGQQCGAKIIYSLEEKAKRDGFQQAIIHSELTAVPFYQKQGYVIISNIYEEDGVPCQTLSKSFS